jgi:hypothetical protein
MPSVEGSNLRPSWRLRTSYPNRDSQTGPTYPIKMLIFSVGSRNVYENKQNMGKMSGKKLDILGKLLALLQKVSYSEGQFTRNCTFFRLYQLAQFPYEGRGLIQ